MTNLTNSERIVLDSIMKTCELDYCADVKDIVRDTGMATESVKGVVGSLAKKGMVLCESEYRGDQLFHDIFPINDNNEIFSFNEWNQGPTL